MRWLWIAAIVAVLAAVSSACGGSDKAAPSLSDADLKAIVMLTSEGLPWQVTPDTDSADSNEQASLAFADPSKWLANYQKWGRTSGHTAAYGLSGSAGASLLTQVEAYSTTGGAKKALSAVRDFMTSGEALLTYTRLGYTNAEVDVIDAAKIAEDSSAYHLTVSVNEDRFDTLVIIFRRGSVIAKASVAVSPDTTETADMEAVANQMDGRIQSLLNGQPTTPQAN